MSEHFNHDIEDQGEWILKPDMSEPAVGLFSVKLGKGHLRRALAVITTNNDAGRIYTVYLDGVIVAPMSMDWRVAFGKMAHNHKDLSGIRIVNDDYVKLVKQRRQDIDRGIDLDDAFDSSQFPVP